MRRFSWRPQSIAEAARAFASNSKIESFCAIPANHGQINLSIRQGKKSAERTFDQHNIKTRNQIGKWNRLNLCRRHGKTRLGSDSREFRKQI
jgi:hypothetical protein